MTPGESTLCSVALNHNDFDTAASHVLQATMTTVASRTLKATSKHVCLMLSDDTNLTNQLKTMKPDANRWAAL